MPIANPTPGYEAGSGEVRVEDAEGRFICFTDEATARRLLASGDAELRRSRASRCVRAKKRRAEEVADPSWLLGSAEPSPFDVLAAIERTEILTACCATLTRRQRSLIRLRYRNELTFAGTARAMGIEVDSAMKLDRRTIDDLRDRLLARGIRSAEEI